MLEKNAEKKNTGKVVLMEGYFSSVIYGGPFLASPSTLT